MNQMNDHKKNNKVIIANCSGFFGDRFSAAKEMVQGGPIDFLTGDYLAELTMAILFRAKSKDPNGGYVSTFLKQMEQVMGECLDRKIRVVSNAGGLNPRALAAELARVAGELGLHPRIACIEGDDLMGRLGELQAAGEAFTAYGQGDRPEGFPGDHHLRQCLPRVLGDRQGPGGGRRYRRGGADRRRLPRRRSGGLVARLESRMIGTGWPAPRRRGTSSNAAPRRPGGIIPLSKKFPASRMSGFPSPRSPQTALS